MKLTITSIELKSPWKFFPLSLYAMRIVNQLKSSKVVEMKKQGVWTKHYTMSLWENEADLKAFAKSGDHLEAMKKSATIARTIRTLTIDADTFLPWNEAKAKLIGEGKTLHFN